MNIRTALSIAALSVLSVVASAAPEFANYGGSGINFLRANDGNTAGTLTGTGTIDGFMLNGMNYNGVTFTLNSTDFQYNELAGGRSDALVGPGSFAFTQGGTTLLSATFTKAVLNDGSFSSSYLDGAVITFGGLVNPLNPLDPSFTFTLSQNPPQTSGNNYAYFSTFGAAGNVEAVPEPATMAALGLGAAAMLRRRRR
ncbi:PEP-CTERM sorting domain-containing protein [bacterium]|nr:MAG: PEP-CTERM sorting domain-containing protein [bacterium]